MDDLDHRCVGEVLEHAPTGAPVSWRSPERGTVYRVTATRTYDIGAGRYCREYRTVATEAGGSEETTGAACRSLAGDWRAVE
jgi:surface antigen